MKNYFLILTFLTFFANPLASQDLNQITQLLEDRKQAFNGHLILVTKQNDSILYTHQTGLATINTRVAIASASKWISAAVILSLADAGYLSLDDPIGKHLPLFKTFGKGHPTIRQCLTHTSGFPPFANIESNPLTLAHLVDSMAKYVPLKYYPGETFEYGEMSYRICGRIAEVVTGKSWAEIFRTYIGEPCEMKNTSYCWDKNIPAIGAGICTSPTDYLNFLQMITQKGVFKNKRVLSENSINQFFISQLPEQVQLKLEQLNPLVKELSGGKPISYGLGSWIINYDINIKEQNQIICPGATGTFPFINRCNNTYGLLLTNTKVGEVIKTELEIFSILNKLYPCK